MRRGCTRRAWPAPRRNTRRRSLHGQRADNAILRSSWEVTVKKILFLAGDVAAVMAAHHMAEILLRHSMKIPATFLNPSDYYLFYVPFFTLLFVSAGRLQESGLAPAGKRAGTSLQGRFDFLRRAGVRELRSLQILGIFAIPPRGMVCAALSWPARHPVHSPRRDTPRFGAAASRARKRFCWVRRAGFADFQDRLAIQRHNGCEIAGTLSNRGQTLSPRQTV